MIRTKLIALLFAACFVLPVYAEYYSIIIPSNSTVNIQIETGKVMQIISYIKANLASSTLMSVKIGTNTASLFSSASSLEYSPSVVPIVGPATITIQSTFAPVFCAYRIIDNDNSITETPSSSVVIPSDASGPVQIILESSKDLITWTSALPGTYGTSEDKRFFRVRAVHTQ